jgi:hypothetical protein
MRSAGLLFAIDLSAIARTASPEQTLFEAARAALGADAIRTLQFTASGATFSVGQNFTPEDPWPRVTLTRYTALIDYEHGSMRQELIREMGSAMPRGGGVPFTGELWQLQGIDSHSAWNVPVLADPSASALPAAPCTPAEVGGTPAQAASAPESQAACELMLWLLTPHGFLKAATANHATTRREKTERPYGSWLAASTRRRARSTPRTVSRVS